MADVNVGVITRWDKLLGETFPYIEEWGSPYSEDYVRLIGERKMTVPAMFQDKVVTQEGAKPPFNGAWFASPPKYPFGRIDTAYFIPAGVQVVENHVAYIVIMVEGDPSDIPPGFEDMGRDDPIEPDTHWISG